MKEELYVQCIMIKNNENILTSWIPEKYAIKDKYLKLKNDDGIWEEGWRVSFIYSEIKKSKKEALIDAEAWKHQRETSDI